MQPRPAGRPAQPSTAARVASTSPGTTSCTSASATGPDCISATCADETAISNGPRGNNTSSSAPTSGSARTVAASPRARKAATSASCARCAASTSRRSRSPPPRSVEPSDTSTPTSPDDCAIASVSWPRTADPPAPRDPTPPRPRPGGSSASNGPRSPPGPPNGRPHRRPAGAAAARAATPCRTGACIRPDLLRARPGGGILPPGSSGLDGRRTRAAGQAETDGEQRLRDIRGTGRVSHRCHGTDRGCPRQDRRLPPGPRGGLGVKGPGEVDGRGRVRRCWPRFPEACSLESVAGRGLCPRPCAC